MSKDAVDRSATPITLADVRAMQWLQRGLTHYLHRVEAPDVDELVVEVDDLCSAIVDSWERGDPSTLDHVQAFITRALSIRTQPVFVLMGFHGAILFEDDEHGYFEFDSPEMARDKVLEILDLCRETGVPVNLEFEISSLKILGARFPEILAQIRKAIHAGLAEIINTTYAHPYLHLVGAESNIRQFEYGGALFTEMFGCRPKVYVCSEFALHPQIPQILRFAGIEFASLRSRLSGNGPSAPYPIIEWEGLDGTCVGGLAHQTNHFVGEYYASVFYKEIFSQLVQAKMGPNRKYVVMSALVDHTVQMEDDVQEAYRVSRFGAVLGRHMTYTQLRNEGPEPAGICRFAYDQFEATRVPNQQGEGLGRRIPLACAALERRLLQVEDLLSRLTFTGNDISACLPPLGDVWRDLLLAQNHDSYTVPYHRPGEFHRHRLHLNPAEFGPYIDKIPLDGPRIGDRTLGLISRATAQLEEIVQGSSKVAEFLGEITVASREQAQGVQQIDSGLEQIDQVTQANTASAEESASASEELASQAQQLQSMKRLSD